MAKRQRKSGKLRQQKDSPDLVKARASWAGGHFARALHQFEKAIRRQPNHPLALADAAQAFGTRFEAARAEVILARLEKIAASRPDEIVLAAQSYRIAHRPMEAIRCLERVLTNHPDHAEANHEYAILLECRGELERALEHIGKFLHADGGSADGKLVKARILSRLADGGTQARPLLAELAEPGTRPLIRAEALSIAAHLLDREGDYDSAFATMMEGKEALERISSGAHRDAEALEPVLLQLRGSVKAAHLKRWAKIPEDAEEDAPPLALMTGARRSGATLLARILSAHPAVAVSDDVSVFSGEIFPAALLANPDGDTEKKKSTELFAGMDEPTRQREAACYRRLLLECLGRNSENTMPLEILIDKSPSLTALIPSFLRIIPHGQLIIPLRDPRDILVSSLFTHFPIDRSTVAFLHPFDAVERISFELETWIHFRSMLPAKRWIEVRYEDVTSDFATEAGHVLDHLGIGWDAVVENYLTAPDQRPVSSPDHIEVTQPIHQRSVARWQNYEEHLDRYYSELTPILGELGYD